jgi:hypothetical protein
MPSLSISIVMLYRMLDIIFLAVLSALPFPFLHLSVLYFTRVQESPRGCPLLLFKILYLNSAIYVSRATELSYVLEQSIIGELNGTCSFVSGLNDCNSYTKIY